MVLRNLQAYYLITKDGRLVERKSTAKSSAKKFRLPASLQDRIHKHLKQIKAQKPKPLLFSYKTGEKIYEIIGQTNQQGQTEIRIFSIEHHEGGLLPEDIPMRALESFPKAVVITDDKPAILWANKAWFSMTGYSPEEVLGKNPSEVVNSGRMSKSFFEKMWSTLLADNNWSGRIINRRKNGELYSEDMLISPFYDSLNKKYYIAEKKELYFADLLETKANNESLKLFELANDIMLIINRYGSIENINHNGAALMGYDKNELIGANWFDLALPPEIKDEVKGIFHKIIRGEGEIVKEYTNEIVTKGGKRLTIKWKNDYITDGKGKISATLSSGTDISQETLLAQKEKNKSIILELFHEITIHIQQATGIEELLNGVYQLFSTIDFISGSWTYLQEFNRWWETGYSHLSFANFESYFATHPDKFEKIFANPKEHFRKNRDMICGSCPLRSIDEGGLVFHKIIATPDKKLGYLHLLVKHAYAQTPLDFIYLNDILNSLASAIVHLHLKKQFDTTFNSLKISEKKLKAIIESISEGLGILNGEYQFEYMNPSGLRLLDIEDSCITGMDFRQFLTPESLDLVTERYRLRQQNIPVPSEYQFSILTAKKRIRKVSVFSQVIRLDNQAKTIVVMQDITEKVAIKKKLKESEQRFRQFFEMDLSGDYISTPDGVLIECNTSFARVLGFSDCEELKRQQISDFYPENYNREDFLQELKDKHFIENKERLYLRRDGKKVSVLENTVGVFDEEGKLKEIQGYIIDITELKEKEQALQQALDKALESDRLKSAFLATMSHEIRTPLNHIIGFANILNNSDMDKKSTRELINSIINSGEGLNTLLSDIIDFSKIEAKAIKIQKSAIDLHQLMRKLLYDNRQHRKILEGHLELMATNDLRQPFYLLADEYRLQQIFNNLISNALKFTHRGSIELSYRVEGQNIHFYVKDTGIGIKPQHQKLIFERFRQVDMSTTRKYEGSGLGLSIAKSLIQLMGGDIDVASDYGLGSTFHFWMPYKPASPPPVIKEKDKQQKQKVSNRKTLKILLVDDDPENRKLLRLILKAYKPVFVEANDGLEAIEAVKAHDHFDLILLDMKMPRLSGYTAAAEIKRINPSLLIVAQSAYALSGDKQKALNAGCDYYLTKPLNFRALKNIIKERVLTKNQGTS